MNDLWQRFANLPRDKQQLVARSLREKGLAVPRPPIVRRTDGLDRAPLSFEQRAVWFFSRLESGTLFNIHRALRLIGPLDQHAMSRTITEVVRRHEVLRTRFVDVAGEPVQIVDEARPIALTVQDLRGSTGDRFEEVLQQALSRIARHEFDLTVAPLWHLELLRRADDEHVLLIVMHHIISDGWSSTILVREIATLYDAFARGQASPLAEPSVQYGDYAAWQHEWLTAETIEAQRSYWREQLGGELPILEVSTDQPRPVAQTYRGAHESRVVAESLYRRVQVRAVEHGATLFMTLLAAWQALLHRYTGQRDIIVGTPVANREWEEIRDLIGLFVNPTAIRVGLAPRLPFAHLIARTREAALGAFAHQAVPFDQVVQLLNVPRTARHPPVFQVAFALQHAGAPVAPHGGLRVEELRMESGTAKVDLALSATPGSSRLTLTLEYNTDLFDRATATRLLQHYEVLLQSAMANPDRPIADLDLLLDEERAAILADGSGDQMSTPFVAVHALIAEQANARPDAVALEGLEEHLTYAALNDHATRVAHYLIAMSVAPETVVGLCCSRAPSSIVGLLGILKAGGAYLPLDATMPADRLRYELEDSGVTLALTDAAADALAGTMIAALDIVGDADLQGYSVADPAVSIDAANLAYVVYTSGSTGRPRGVMVSHENLLNTAIVMGRRYATGPGARRLQFVSPGFDAFGEEVFTTLCHGATLTIAGHVGRRSPKELRELCACRAVTAIHMPPSYWHGFATDWKEAKESALDALSLIVVGGESPSPSSVGEWMSVAGAEARWLNAYGPTEATVTATVFEVNRTTSARADAWNRVPIGGPVDNVRTYVVDGSLQPVPVGVAGELYLGGAGIARGYLGAPAATAERFVPNPFGTDGARLYRTGDVARWRDDRQLEFVSRRDTQVKIRGYRVELGEIETAVRGASGVRDAAVTLRAEAGESPRLVAYVVPTAPDSWNERVPEWRRALQRRLPDYMVPAVWVSVEALPRTAHGKLDRDALPAPPPERPPTVGDYVAPRSEHEQTLAEIWAEVLRIDHVGADDNFFELGGDSILSIQVAARAARAGLELTVQQIFQHPTVAALAAVVTSSGDRQQVSEQGEVTGVVPLTPIQQWFFTQPWTQPAHFNQSVLLAVREALDEDALRAAVAGLLMHHDALRQRYQRVDGAWLQIGAAWDAVVPLVVEPATTDAAAWPAALEARCAWWQTQFDLARGPLLRVVWFPGPAGRQRLLLVAHHLVVDGVSWRILLEDVERGYRQARAGEPVHLGAKTASFRQWARWLETYGARDAVTDEAPYWRAQVEPSAPTATTAVSGTAVVRTVRGQLSPAATRALLQDVGRAYGTEITHVLIAALVEAFAQVRGQGAVHVDLEGHGRVDVADAPDVTRTVGWFTVQYPVRVSGGADLGTTIKTVKEQLRAVPHAGLGYGLLRYGAASPLGPPPARAEVSFNYLGQLDGALPAASIFEPAPEAKGASQGPIAQLPAALIVIAQVWAGALHVAWSYDAREQSGASVEALATAYLAALDAIVAHCQRPDAGGSTPSDFPLAALDQAQLDRLFGARRDLEDVYPLSPMQQGLLFHSLYDPSAGVYVSHLSSYLRGLDVDAFERAWQYLVDRHAILRTSFMWEGVPEPLQVVHRTADAPLEILDWRGLSEIERESRFDERFNRDYSQPSHRLRLDVAPVMQLCLARVGAAEYQLTWTFHHLLLDGWSTSLLIQDLVAAYEAFARDEQPRLLERRPYHDYIDWLRHRDMALAEAFWRDELRGFTVPTPLPGARRRAAREANPSADVQVCRVSLSADQTSTLDERARRHAITLNTVAQAAWALLLARYSGRRSVVFGATTAGRPADLAGADRMVGLFINTLPVRAEIPTDGTSIASWLHAFQDRQLRAREYEWAPLLEVNKWSAVRAGTPLFESLFVFERFPTERAASDAGTALRFDRPRAKEHTHYPITLEVVPGRQLQARLAYDATRIDEATVSKVAEHYLRLLEECLADPSRPAHAVSFLSSDEEQQLARQWSGVGRPVPPVGVDDTRCAHELFERTARRVPDAIAVSRADEHWSYQALDRWAADIATELETLGCQPDHPIAMMSQRGPEYLAAMLGVFKAGGAFVPLDVAYPADRLSTVLGQSQPRVLLASRERERDARRLAERAGASERPVVASIGPHAAKRRDVPRAIASADASSLAYVIYTSGSTGVPKGAMVEHRGMVNHLVAKIADLSLGSEDVVAQTAPHGFDISVWQYLAPLLVGGRVSVAPADALVDPAILREDVLRSGVTVLEVVPSMLEALLETGRDPAIASAGPRWVIVTGEELSTSLCARWFAAGEWTPLLNAYGPTECSDDVTHGPIVTAPADPLSRVPIGRPIRNLCTYVLDAALQPPIAGVPGELYVGGVGVGRGYLHDPARTAERFLPDPFGEAGARMYRTGDRAAFREDGNLDFLGRDDYQVKLRGCRIELSEIELALQAQPSVNVAAVMPDLGPAGSLVLTAYVSARENARVDGHALAAALGDSLPAYMVPSTILVLDEMPLTANGKVDRAALATMSGRATSHRTPVAPRTPLERVLADLWADVFHLPSVGIHDDFFELGGHSLMATQLASRIKQTFDVESSLRGIFESRTIAELASHLLAQPGQRQRIERIAELLVRVAALSEDEARSALDRQAASTSAA